MSSVSDVALYDSLRRIRAAAESDADLENLPALRGFLLQETKVAANHLTEEAPLVALYRAQKTLGMPPTTEEHFEMWGRYICETCLLVGAQYETAARVSACFVQAIRPEGSTP